MQSISRSASKLFHLKVPYKAQARSLEDVDFVAHRTRKSLTELRQMGDREIANIGSYGKDCRIETGRNHIKI